MDLGHLDDWERYMETLGCKLTFFFAHCRDGRIKVIGGDNIEGLLISPNPLPYKYLQVSDL